MKQIIYVDVLVVLNTVVTFIMLLTTAAVTGVKNSVGRLLIGAVTGGLFSLILLAPEMSVPCVLLTKAAMAVSLVVCFAVSLLTPQNLEKCDTEYFYNGQVDRSHDGEVKA